MPQATDNHTTPTRRRALRLGATALTASLAALGMGAGKDQPPIVVLDRSGASAPDAELIAACDEFHRQHAALDEIDGEIDEAMATRWALSDEIREMVPTSAAGLRAKGQVAVTLIEENMTGGCVDGDLDFAYLTLLNPVGRAAA